MSLYQKASLVQIPSGYKAADDKLYSVVPSNGDGDFTIDSDADATRVNKDGLIETTVADQARLDYDPSNPQDPHLLLEPTRTNSITYSEDFSNSSYNKNNSTVTVNNTTAPDGTNNADKITSTGTTPYARVTFTHSTSTSYSVSIFGKKGDEDFLYIRALALSNQPTASFNLSTGALGTINSGLTAEIEGYPNGWYRCVIKYTTASSISNNLIDFGFAASDNSRTSSSGKFSYFWGTQIEQGIYPTSYIPTSGSAVTRTADNCKIDSGLAAYIGNPSGTFFVDVEFDRIGTSSSYGRFVLSDQTSNINRIIIDNFNGNIRAAVVYSGGSISVGNVSQVSETRYKLAFSYKSGDNTFCINGTNYNNTGTYTLTADMESIKFSDYGGTNNKFQGKLHQLMVFNTALTDAELITLTT